MAYTYNYSLILSLLDGTTEMSSENYAETKQAVTEITKQIIAVPDGTTDLVISLGDITTAKTLIIKSSQTIDIMFDALDAFTGKLLFLKGTTITDLKISNDSGAAAVVSVFITD